MTTGHTRRRRAALLVTVLLAAGLAGCGGTGSRERHGVAAPPAGAGAPPAPVAGAPSAASPARRNRPAWLPGTGTGGDPFPVRERLDRGSEPGPGHATLASRRHVPSDAVRYGAGVGTGAPIDPRRERLDRGGEPLLLPPTVPHSRPPRPADDDFDELRKSARGL